MLWITNLISITIMRYTKFIALLATMLVSVACFQDDLDFDRERIDTESDIITIYGNVARFADCKVSTRANKTPEESYVSKMALAVFTKDGNECIHYELRDGSNLLYTLDRAKIRETCEEKYGDETRYDNVPCVMYIFANMPKLQSSWNGTLKELLDLLVYEKPGLTRPDTGFPMIGSLGDESRDGKSFVLIPMSGNRMELPTVDDTPTDYLNIPMSAIFAKMSFEITVSPDQDVDVHAPARFEMTGYEVHNLPSAVSFNSEQNKEGIQEVSSELVEVAISGIAQGGDEGSGSKIEFDFYLPERLVTPDKSADAYKYPLGENGADVTGYSQIPAKNKKYAQRYKPKLLGDGQTPTYITIKGKYRDHHEQYYGVEYDIYLGADNYGDFNIKRNNQYYNKLNIRGIASSNDQTQNENSISIDHRVNVERSSPLIVSIRRETQLDAHFEVRPMRLRISGDVPEGAKTVVEVLDENGGSTNIPTWVRLEKSGTTDDYYITTEGSSKGKRMYFTTDLVTNTLKNSTRVEVTDLKNDANSTVWIYVDEANPADATTTRTTRSATIRVTYTDNSGNNDVKDYHISQYNLHKIEGTSGQKYYIECYEEYLYNYDSEDSYGQIREDGLPWGLDGVQLSNKHNSFYIDEDNEQWNTHLTNNTLLKYDFYIGKYDTFVDENIAVHGYAGQHFTKEIYDATKGNSDVNKKVNVLTMADQPKGAVEYCYNRNKRQSDGSVAEEDLVWYLPSADELEDFIVPAYNYYKEFQDNYYWTSQPAYIRNAFYYEYATGWSQGRSVTDSYAFVAYEDNPNCARATKVIAKGNDVFEYALSGLNKVSTDPDDKLDDCLNGGNEVLFYNSYFTKMYAWYRWSRGTNSPTWTTDTHFNWIKNSSETGVRFHVEVGHEYKDMYQEDENGEHGYRFRTESHRVRCARRDWKPGNNYEMVPVYTVSSDTPAATSLDKSGSTMYVMKNTNYNTYLTTQGTNVAANDSDLGRDNYVIIEGNIIKSVLKNQYFNGYNGNVSFNDGGTSYTISNSDSNFPSNFTISYTYDPWIGSTTTYYLKQTDNGVSMSSGNNGNNTWNFYEVKKEYKVVE